MVNAKVEAGGEVLKSLMVSLKEADKERAAAAKEKAERRKAKYQTWNGR